MDGAPPSDVHSRLVALLTASGVSFRLVEHAEAETSKEAAEIRGSRLEQGAKALVLTLGSKGPAGNPYVLAVVPAHRSLDARKLRTSQRFKSLSMASPEAVLDKFGLLKGSVPPFGSVLGVPVFVDPSLRDNEEIVFNAGLRTKSVFLRVEDFDKIEKPIWVDIVGE